MKKKKLIREKNWEFCWRISVSRPVWHDRTSALQAGIDFVPIDWILTVYQVFQDRGDILFHFSLSVWVSFMLSSKYLFSAKSKHF